MPRTRAHTTEDRKIKQERPPLSRSASENGSEPSGTGSGLSQESFSEFSQVITHRIGSLLSSIEGYTDLILPSLHQSDDRENAFRILEGVSRINGVLSDLKHYQESLKLSLHLVEARLLGTEVIQLLSDSEADRIRIESSISDSVLINADDRLLRQALLSIIRNAFEAVQTEKLAISFLADTIEEGQMVRFRIFSPSPITDEGVRKQIFRPFFTTKASNMGLGLTMARRIFREHGGEIRLSSSDIELGTEFTCTIPCASQGS